MKNVAVELGCELGNEVTNLQGFIFASALAVKEFAFLFGSFCIFVLFRIRGKILQYNS